MGKPAEMPATLRPKSDLTSRVFLRKRRTIDLYMLFASAKISGKCD